MESQELLDRFQERLDEARLYFSQGLGDTAVEILEEFLREIEGSDSSESEKNEARSLTRQELKKIIQQDVFSTAEIEADEGSGDEDIADPSQVFQYGLALMDGLFWDEAIAEFKRAAKAGYRSSECWELCGDCSSLLERWEEAISFYNLIYRDEQLPDDLRKKILLKITRCSQTQKKNDAKPSPQPPPDERGGHGAIESVVASLDQEAISQLIGLRLESWHDAKGHYLAGESCAYRVLNFLHVGMTSLVVEVEDETTGKRLAGQGFYGPYSGAIGVEQLAAWVETQMVCRSRHLVKILDLAHADDFFFVIREYLPVSLGELLTGGDVLPIPIAVFMAYQVLEGLGDLHLRMGSDDQIHKLYHLDLRPSRVLIDIEKPVVKIYNGGMWELLQKKNPASTNIKELPLSLLAYRAPEQFRPYLARRKPPVFTDIYLFGSLFYEMLTGVPAFRASSYDEYEIQHCEQYPTPPKVWRPEIPDQLNEMIMKCLENDPLKRWRSATELSLLLEKPFYHFVNPPRDGSLTKFFRNKA